MGFDMRKQLLTFRACIALRWLLVAAVCSLLFAVACGGAQNNGGSSGEGACFPAASVVYPGTQSVTYNFNVLHSFAGHLLPATPEGGHPYAGMVMDGAGNLYGTALSDGANYFGTVYKIDAHGHETTLHNFTDGTDGGFPWSLPVLDNDCNLYGTTQNGGAGGYGTLFKLDTVGHLTVLHAFSGADGNAPRGGLIRDASGNIYGTTEFGGVSDMGVVFKLNPDGTYTVLHSFNGAPEQAGSIRVVHMHGELFKSRCDRCTRTPFHDTTTYDPPIQMPRCDCGGRIRPHICWFGEMPFELDRIFRALDECTVFIAVGTSGVVEPAASFVAHVVERARTIYVGPEEPANASAFTECHLGKAGEMLPDLFGSF